MRLGCDRGDLHRGERGVELDGGRAGAARLGYRLPQIGGRVDALIQGSVPGVSPALDDAVRGSAKKAGPARAPSSTRPAPRCLHFRIALQRRECAHVARHVAHGGDTAEQGPAETAFGACRESSPDGSVARCA